MGEKEFVTPEGIEKRNNYYYYTGCDCIGSEHGVTLWFELDYGISLFTETSRCARNFRDRIRLALRMLFRMLFRGYLYTDGEVVLRNPQHAKDIAMVLNHLADIWGK